MKSLIRFLTKVCENFLPDAFVFCLLMTLFVFLSGYFLTPFEAKDLIRFWGKEFWSLHSFAMQMVFILITGQIMAKSPAMMKILNLLTSIVQKESHALILISLFSFLTSWINWGLGLVLSALLAREMAKKLKRVHFGLFIATAYSGFLVWHGGLSGTIPLKIAGADEILHQVYPGLSFSLTETLFSPLNLTLLLLLFITMPILALLMNSEEKVELVLPEDEEYVPQRELSFRDKMENSRWINVIFFFLFLSILFLSTTPLDINKLNFIFLAFALLLQQTPRRFLWALNSSIRQASGIIIQFPFYAGIMGIMKHSGLVDQMASWFVQVSNAQTLPLLTFYSAGLVNFFVPSGGGQWIIQGPVMLKAAKALSVDPQKICLALSWGDAWSNLIQPFWALPLLSLAHLQLKDIMGFCLMFTIVSGLLLSLVFFIF